MRDECTVFEAPKELKKAEEELDKIMRGCRRVDKKPFQLKLDEVSLSRKRRKRLLLSRRDKKLVYILRRKSQNRS